MSAATTPPFEEQHAKNMHILGLIRDEPGWALSRILLAEKCEVVCRQIADPSYTGNYSDEEVVAIYRTWAKNALPGGTS